MPFDEESAPPQDPEPSRGFSHDQMVRCEACLRANPPTRTGCLYCGAQLPATEAGEAFRQPTLRRLETWEKGFNVILLPTPVARFSTGGLRRAAELLRLELKDLWRMTEAQTPLPVARAATREEAALVERKLAELGFRLLMVSDDELGVDASNVKRALTFDLMEDALLVYPAVGRQSAYIPWTEVALTLSGRLFYREVAVEERKGRRAEKEIVEAREVSRDEAVLDIYTTLDSVCWRVYANRFDFSCLGRQKGLVAEQNFETLREVLEEHAYGMVNDGYMKLRPMLAHAWPDGQRSEARGWRRNAPGRVTTEEVARSDNEAQFTRYSRMSYYIQEKIGSF